MTERDHVMVGSSAASAPSTKIREPATASKVTTAWCQVPSLYEAVVPTEDREADGLLVGRRTFEDLRGYWPKQSDDATGIADYLNQVQKYVVSSTVTQPEWLNSTILSGDQLIDARQSFDPQTNEPNVTIAFDNDGGRRFARVTQQNVNKPFAIIVDNQVISAPNINEPILGGNASISGSFTVESANALAIALRSGKLPVALKVIEERTVGPDLGADSIRAGITASVAGMTLVALFMLMYYRLSGINAILIVDSMYAMKPRRMIRFITTVRMALMPESR